MHPNDVDVQRPVRNRDRTSHSGRLGGFAVVGAAAFIVQMALFNLLISVPVRPVVSNAVAVVASIAVAYLGNRRLTYRREHNARAGRELLRFVAVNAFAFTIGELGIVCAYLIASRPDRLIVNSFTVLGVAMGTALRLWAYPRFVFTAERLSTP